MSGKKRDQIRSVWKPMTVPRSAIVAAPYNPRKISKEAQVRLKRSLKTHGLIDPLVWNERTGHLVGGHQRLVIMDQEAGGKSYEVGVAAINVDDAEERRINVLLNQESLSGDWDPERLRTLIGDAKPEEFGFSSPELEAVCGIIERKFTERVERDAEQLKAWHKELRAKTAAYVAKKEERNTTSFYVVATFSSQEERNRFMCRFGEVSAPYVDGAMLMAALKR